MKEETNYEIRGQFLTTKSIATQFTEWKRFRTSVVAKFCVIKFGFLKKEFQSRARGQQNG